MCLLLKNRKLILIYLYFLIFAPLEFTVGKHGGSIQNVIPMGFAEEAPDNLITVTFVDEDIRFILNLLAKQQNLNIVLSDKVAGNVTIRLVDVSFWVAFKTILEMKGLVYKRVDNIIKVSSLDEMEALRKKKEELIPEMEIEIFYLKYANAVEIKELVDQFLSTNGSTTVYYSTIRGGWPVAGIAEEGQTGVIPRTADKKQEFPRILVVRDLHENIQKIRKLIEQVDKLPEQVLIECLIAEVRYDRGRDIGIDWEALGQEGAAGESSYIVGEGGEVTGDIGTDVEIAGVPTTGLTFTYTRLIGAKFEATIRAMEEEGRANILSKPKMLVLNGHEGTILVGEKYPIFTAELSVETGRVISEEVERYEPVGITLKVVPVIWENDNINIAIHPAITALGDDVVGTTGLKVARIVTREVDTNITINSGDTVVIGGLIKNEEEITQYRVPILGQIPILGWLFRREYKDVGKIELLIFLTPSIVEDAVLPVEEEVRFQELQEFLGKEKE